MSQPALFKYPHYEAEIILLCLRWGLRYSLSYRDLEEIVAERGLSVDHTTIYINITLLRSYAEKAMPSQAEDDQLLLESRRGVCEGQGCKGAWMYLYRAVDWDGNTVEFMLSPDRKIGMHKLPNASSVRLYVPGTPFLHV